MKAKGYLSKFVLSLSKGEAPMKSAQLQKIRGRWEFTGEIFGIALGSLVVWDCAW